MSNMTRCVVWIFLIANLTACATFKDSEQNNHEAICKQLKYKMIWNGAGGTPTFSGPATGDPTKATQTRAESETLEKNYHDEGCD